MVKINKDKFIGKEMVLHMRVNGIIAEYNPFHNGHKYHLEESLRRTQADYSVIVMSGDFVQRGGPAMLDKHTRAEMALHCGADLVLELPVLYAAASAEYFASGAIALLDKLGVITHLCFGSEYPASEKGNNIPLLQIASLLVEEPEAYRYTLKEYLRRGSSFPLARAMALSQCYPNLEHQTNTFSSPNNILGIEYCKAILKRKSRILPIPIPRLGAGYHDGEISSRFGSALAIRKALLDGYPAEKLRKQLPEAVLTLLMKHMEESPPISSDLFSNALYYKLLMEKDLGYEKYLDVSKDLSNRIRNLSGEFTGFDAFCELIKTKDMAYTRISRSLLHILLGIKKAHMDLGRKMDYTPYARVLGFRRQAAPLLNAIKKQASIPLITKVADARKNLPPDAGKLLQLDILSGELYLGTAALQSGKKAINEISRQIVTV